MQKLITQVSALNKGELHFLAGYCIMLAAKKSDKKGKAGQGQLPELVLCYLEQVGPGTTQEIANKLGKAKTTVSSALSALKGSKKLQAKPRRRYAGRRGRRALVYSAA